MSTPNNAATIPYQLRHHKAIERNLFVDLLKKLSSCAEITLSEYKYVGFGAAFLEDFKSMHLEFGIRIMDSMECDNNAYTRQEFNKPYDFIKTINCMSSHYVSDLYDTELPTIIWLDYASPKNLRDQLIDLELLGSKVLPLDILKFTFNAQISSFASTNGLKESNGNRLHQIILDKLKNDETFQHYISPNVGITDIKNFDVIIRDMGVRAIKRGLAKTGKGYEFNSLSAFKYADGQNMTTLTGVITNSKEQFQRIYEEARLKDWPFTKDPTKDFIESEEISVPSMTFAERFALDKILYNSPKESIHDCIEFKYGNNNEEHKKLIEGYCKYYKYLPYYGKIIY